MTIIVRKKKISKRLKYLTKSSNRKSKRRNWKRRISSWRKQLRRPTTRSNRCKKSFNSRWSTNWEPLNANNKSIYKRVISKLPYMKDTKRRLCLVKPTPWWKSSNTRNKRLSTIELTCTWVKPRWYIACFVITRGRAWRKITFLICHW